MEVSSTKYIGDERRKFLTVEKGVLKVWHFIVSQIILFITIMGFMFSFGSWSLSQLQRNFYSKSSGEQLEKMVEKLNNNLERQNDILTDLRIYIARNVRNGDTIVVQPIDIPKDKTNGRGNL